MRISNAGLVGIGTAVAPFQKLTVTGSIPTILKFGLFLHYR